MRARLEITTRCNLNCIHCAATAYKTKVEWTTQEALSVFEDMVGEGTDEFDFLGGEPFIRADILELFSFLNERRAHLLISTNGLLLDEETISALVKLEYLSGIFFSVDGASKEVYETIRGKNTYEKMLSNMEALVSCREETNSSFRIGLNCVVNGVNARECGELVALADQMGLDAVSMINIGWIGNALLHKEKLYVDPKTEFAAYESAISKTAQLNRIRSLKGMRPLSFSIDSVPATWKYYFVQKYPLLSQSRGKYQCMAGEGTIFVDAQGVLYPCEAVRIHQQSIEAEIGEYAPMALPEHTFREVATSEWFTKAVAYIKDRAHLLKDVIPCKSCQYNDGCSVCPLHAQSEKIVHWCTDT